MNINSGGGEFNSIATKDVKPLANLNPTRNQPVPSGRGLGDGARTNPLVKPYAPIDSNVTASTKPVTPPPNTAGPASNSKLGNSSSPRIVNKQESAQEGSDELEFADQAHDHSFYQQLSIHIDQPVVGMSISPSKRDIVLASLAAPYLDDGRDLTSQHFSRQGLFIVDLECPFDPPRTLPYFSRWEVSQVHWNPHPTRDTWIATTCNHKVLVWNLLKPRLNSVEFTLARHTRAVSDLCWSNHHPEVLGTASLDTSVKIWDLRDDPHRAAHTLMGWNMAVAQIDFHPHDQHLLATGQESELRIWDIRRGSHPIHIVPAHDRRIANLHWNPACRKEILTCSYDTTIKFWDIDHLASHRGIIETKLPVGRARYAPFGRGVISFPLRFGNDLSLWDKLHPERPAFRYQGHTGIVKEFVWRIHGRQPEARAETAADDRSDGREFQLVTFSLDRQLRLWPVSEAQMTAVGHHPHRTPLGTGDGRAAAGTSFSYRTPRHCTLPLASPAAQLHPKPAHGDTVKNPSPPPHSSPLSGSPRSILPLVPQRPHRTYNFMAVEAASGWMRLCDASGEADWVVRTLAEEFRLVSQLFKRVKFEKVNVPGRTCTITLHGPWAKDGGPAFLRVGVRFPAEYPNQAPPHFELHRSGMISLANRAAIADSLPRIAQSYVARGAYCLKACLSYLLGEKPPLAVNSDSDSGLSDEETRLRRRLPAARDGVERDDHNVPFPRMCGGVFGGDGQLILYFSSLNALPAAGVATSVRGLLRNSYYQTHPRSYESLELFRTMTSLPPRIITRHPDRPSPTSDDLDDLLTIPSLFYRPNCHPQARPSAALFATAAEDLPPPADSLKGNVIHIRPAPGTVPADPALAQAYCAYGAPLAEAIVRNRAAAKARGRKDLARLWKLVGRITMFLAPGAKDQAPYAYMAWGSHPFGSQLLCSLLHHFEAKGDCQTLAMLACTLDLVRAAPATPTGTAPTRYSLACNSPKDYFSDSFYHKPFHPLNAPKPATPKTPSPLSTSKPRAAPRTSDLFDPTGVLSIHDTGELTEGPGSHAAAKVEAPPGTGLQSRADAIRLVHYRMLYADTLYRWGMLVPRAELMKTLVQEGPAHQGLVVRPTCPRCSGPLQAPSRHPDTPSPKPGWFCPRCARPRGFPRCSICNLSVKGTSSFCSLCGHGGHLDHVQEWFQTCLYTECPTGCGCACIV
ncbi:hypothetical protein L0F63_005860 [Massospora cicadina]|nr:hypothetical protein L0F63_005860 [Massospora cicadina]